MTIFLMSFLGCLAAVAFWNRFEKRTRRDNPVSPITVHEVFNDPSYGVSHTSTAFIDSGARRFQIHNSFDTALGVRNYDYRLINGAVYVRLVDDYDQSYQRSPRTALYDVYEGFIVEDRVRARVAESLHPKDIDEVLECLRAEIVWHRLSSDAFNSISSVLSAL
jgi:hypothetical protein